MPLRFAPRATEAFNQPLIVKYLLSSSAMSAASEEIIYRDQMAMTYADLNDRIGRLANVLAAFGVKAGTTVAVLDWDSHRYLESFFAIPMLGAVIQTANIRLSKSQLQFTLEHAQAEVLLVHRDFLPIIDELRGALPRVGAIIALMDGSADMVPAWCVGEYEKLLSAAAPKTDFDDFDENALATTFYTSGTTGLPKAVCFSHRQIVLHTLGLTAALSGAAGPGMRRDDVYMPLTPMFHVHAWGVPFAATMLGLKQVYPGRYEPAMILQLRREHDVTFSHCVPTILQMLIDAAATTADRLDGWHLIIGGSALTRELFDDARALGIVITVGYGMSETGPVMAIARHGEDEHASIRSGTSIPLVNLRIVDPEMNDVAADDKALGEIVVRSPWLSPCYLADPDASEELWRAGWLHTQDIATMSANGSVQIRDRVKDVIKSGGEWICSISLEDMIASRSDVKEVAVIGVPHPKWQERPVAIIVPNGVPPILSDIHETLRASVDTGQLSAFALVDAVHVVDALPKTSVGKIDKKALRASFAGSD